MKGVFQNSITYHWLIGIMTQIDISIAKLMNKQWELVVGDSKIRSWKLNVNKSREMWQNLAKDKTIPVLSENHGTFIFLGIIRPRLFVVKSFLKLESRVSKYQVSVVTDGPADSGSDWPADFVSFSQVCQDSCSSCVVHWLDVARWSFLRLFAEVLFTSCRYLKMAIFTAPDGRAE